ncbi:uncharacterized protein L201_008050 [Kwoniella dendrophila CBS 6074]|uniref:Ras modification protein ERF4 n=1 Tax=Kwoniella dendrophila CBS 6074 TaxID=1295534 RepID=A0AAX4K684_9TREE
MSTSNIPFTPSPITSSSSTEQQAHPLSSPDQYTYSPSSTVNQTPYTHTGGKGNDKMEETPFIKTHLSEIPEFKANNKNITHKGVFSESERIEQKERRLENENYHKNQNKNNNVISSFSVIRDRQNNTARGKYQDWEEGYEKQKLQQYKDKIDKDLTGWRGGHGKPRSYYSLQALPPHSYFHQPITGTIGKHLPKEIIRIDRDWSGGEVCQFDTVYPMELDGRIQPNQILTFITGLNEILYSAYAVRAAIWDNLIAVGTLWTSLFWRQSHFEKELQRAEKFIRESNQQLFNPQGLNVLSPRFVALQFLEIEYY